MASPLVVQSGLTPETETRNPVVTVRGDKMSLIECGTVVPVGVELPEIINGGMVATALAMGAVLKPPSVED